MKRLIYMIRHFFFIFFASLAWSAKSIFLIICKTLIPSPIVRLHSTYLSHLSSLDILSPYNCNKKVNIHQNILYDPFHLLFSNLTLFLTECISLFHILEVNYTTIEYFDNKINKNTKLITSEKEIEEIKENMKITTSGSPSKGK